MTGKPTIAQIVTQPAIAAAPLLVEVPNLDQDTGEQIGTVQIVNPLIVQDDTERAIASAVIATAPAAVTAALASLPTVLDGIPTVEITLPAPPAATGWVWAAGRWVIDINTASASELQTVDGIGAALADAIVAARPFQAPADLAALSGISAAMVDGWATSPGLVAMQTT